jgi:DNA mismatch endonuclease (patch repair protein)
MPKTNADYWLNKIARNRKRDREVDRILKQDGWKVIRLWAYDVKHQFDNCIQIIFTALEKESGAATQRQYSKDIKRITNRASRCR